MLHGCCTLGERILEVSCGPNHHDQDGVSVLATSATRSVRNMSTTGVRARLRRVSLVEAAVLLVGAGVVAGVVGSGGGVSSLVSYPALLGVGIPPLPANLANLVAGVAIAPGAALSSRRELADARSVLIGLLPVSVAGTVVGAGLLLLTPPGVFARVVPFLVLTGSLVLIVQPALLKLGGRDDVNGPSAVPRVLIGAVSAYGGYFGAGSGVRLLAVLLLVVYSRVPPANAIKNVLLGAISLAAAVVFIAIRPVPWSAILPLAGGLLLGSAIGPIIVRHIPPSLVRWIAAGFGLVLAAYLWLRAG